jgi:flagellar motility protein MotE (MotC chaperone)
LQSLIDEIDELLDENVKLRQCISDEAREATLRGKLRRDNGELQKELQEREKNLIEMKNNLEVAEEELVVTRSKLRFVSALLSQTLDKISLHCSLVTSCRNS